MKDIRILGDVVRVKLRELGVPVTPYIIFENLLVLAFCTQLTFFLPHSDIPHSFLPLAAILIGAIYGIKSGLLGLCVFLILVVLGFPEALTGEQGIWGSTGMLLGLLPATALAGLSANFEWDRDLKRSIYFIGFAQLIAVSFGMVWLKVLHNAPELMTKDFVLGVALSIALNTILGALILKIIWEAVINYDTDSEQATE